MAGAAKVEDPMPEAKGGPVASGDARNPASRRRERSVQRVGPGEVESWARELGVRNRPPWKYRFDRWYKAYWKWHKETVVDWAFDEAPLLDVRAGAPCGREPDPGSFWGRHRDERGPWKETRWRVRKFASDRVLVEGMPAPYTGADAPYLALGVRALVERRGFPVLVELMPGEMKRLRGKRLEYQNRDFEEWVAVMLDGCRNSHFACTGIRVAGETLGVGTLVFEPNSWQDPADWDRWLEAGSVRS